MHLSYRIQIRHLSNCSISKEKVALIVAIVCSKFINLEKGSAVKSSFAYANELYIVRFNFIS